MDRELTGKTVIVTGGGSNIGRAITLGCAREGARIMLANIDLAQAEAVAVEARAAGAAVVVVARCDVTDQTQVKAMFTQTTPALWQKIIQVNFVGVLNCTFEALALMAPQNGGAIVSISSDASRQGEPREAVYGGMKGGINSCMKTIAKSLPLKKIGRPRDIADAVLLLASTAVAGHVTRQVLSVSGGYSMIG